MLIIQSTKKKQVIVTTEKTILFHFVVRIQIYLQITHSNP